MLVLFALSLSWTSDAAFADDDAKYNVRDGFSLFVQSRAINPNLGSFIGVDMGQYDSLDSLTDSFGDLKTADGEVLYPDPDKPIEIRIVVPKNAPKRYVDAYVAKVHEQFEKLYNGHALFRVEMAYVDVEMIGDQLEATAKKMEQELLKSKGLEREAIADLADRLAHDHKSLKTWRDRWFGRPIAALEQISPQARQTAAKVVFWSKLGISGGVVLTKYGFNMASALIALASGTISGLFGYYAVPFENWVTTHRLFLTRKFPVLEKFPLIRLYSMECCRCSKRQVISKALASQGSGVLFLSLRRKGIASEANGSWGSIEDAPLHERLGRQPYQTNLFSFMRKFINRSLVIFRPERGSLALNGGGNMGIMSSKLLFLRKPMWISKSCSNSYRSKRTCPSSIQFLFVEKLRFEKSSLEVQGDKKNDRPVCFSYSPPLWDFTPPTTDKA